MNYNDALNSIIDDGIEAARNDYSRPDQSQKREGSILGFEECRGLNPSQLAALLAESHAMTMTKHRNQASDYWYWRCRDIEIGWVCNVISAILVINEMRPIKMCIRDSPGTQRASHRQGEMRFLRQGQPPHGQLAGTSIEIP